MDHERFADELDSLAGDLRSLANGFRAAPNLGPCAKLESLLGAYGRLRGEAAQPWLPARPVVDQLHDAGKRLAGLVRQLPELESGVRWSVIDLLLRGANVAHAPLLATAMVPKGAWVWLGTGQAGFFACVSIARLPADHPLRSLLPADAELYQLGDGAGGWTPGLLVAEVPAMDVSRVPPWVPLREALALTADRERFRRLEVEGVADRAAQRHEQQELTRQQRAEAAARTAALKVFQET
jgi:hypothetical protein